MNTIWKYKLLYLIVVIVLFAVDQATKIWAIQALDHRNMSYQIIENYLELRIVYNTGAAWGILSGWTQGLAVKSTILIIIIITVLGRTSLKDRLLGWALTFQLGGAFGNLYDRLSSRRGVVDFINTHIPLGGGENGIWDRLFGAIGWQSAKEWAASQPRLYDYPVFNFADIWIVIGTIMLITYIMLMSTDDKAKKEAKSENQKEPEKIDQADSDVAVSETSIQANFLPDVSVESIHEMLSDELEVDKESGESRD